MSGNEYQRPKEEMDDQPARLPEDVLAAILRRVPPLWIAVSRCVCRAWRDAVDGRGLLRADRLPHTLAGFFLHFNEHKFPEFFARLFSSAAGRPRAVSGNLSFLPSASPHRGYIYEDDCLDGFHYNILDHCNGLLLLSGDYVVNPATRRWRALPACPSELGAWSARSGSRHGAGGVRYRAHLVYDPMMISPYYYQVFMIPTLGGVYRRGEEVDPSMEGSEWPPSLCKMYVFSSKSGCWEERCFGREGDAAGIVGDMRVGHWPSRAVYLRGLLYVHCRPNFIMRISLSNDTYRVIKSPVVRTGVDYCLRLDVVRSEKGVYFVEADKSRDKYRLRVWILNESCGQMEWMLKHDKDLKPMLARQRFYRRAKWILEDINYSMFYSSRRPEDNRKATRVDNIEWINSHNDVENEDMIDHCYLEDNKKAIVGKNMELNSNNYDALDNGDTVEECYWAENHYDYINEIEILGFHPYKEIVFFSASEQTGLAYNLNGSTIESLGNIYPKEYTHFKELPNEKEKIESFPYTPCWSEEFPLNS